MSQILNTGKPQTPSPRLTPPAPPPSHLTLPALSRRAAAAAAAIVAAPALLSATPLVPRCRAEEATESCAKKLPVTRKAFLDVSIGGEPAGRITIGLFGDAAPLGASRFLSLATGVGYRRKEFTKVMPGYVQHAGVISYAASPVVSERLEAEMDALRVQCGAGGALNAAGTVSVVVRDPTRPPPKPKLVAKGGKLEIEQEEVGVAPNATEFVIATKDVPELDASTLVVGRVVDGMDVVEKMARVASVKDNTGSPYFRVAKLIGDKRAVVAERGFNRPYTKIIVTNCGSLS